MGSQLVSILIPVYNREEFISQTIYSALEQTYKNIEVIVVDNCSSDNTWKIIKTFLSIDKRVKAYRNDSNIGPVKNWLRCIQKAKGVYGKILWSDDLMSPQFIEESMNAITKFNDVGFVYSAVGYIDNDGNKIGYAYHLDGSEGIKKTSSFISRALLGDSDIPVSPGCALFRLKTLKKNLIVDIPNRVNADTNILAIGNDLLLFLLTCKDYDKYYYIQNVNNFFRIHQGSISVSSERGKLSAFYSVGVAYFISIYPDIDARSIDKFNARLFVQRMLLNQGKFGFKDWRSFYPKEMGFRVENIYAAGFLMTKISRLVKRNLRVIFKNL